MIMSFVYIDNEIMEQICHRMAMKVFDSKEEPIPPFANRNNGLLDSALKLPMATFGGIDLYSTLEEKATVLYYSMVKNHAFYNGNKRIATATVLVFIRLNGFWIYKKTNEMSRITIDIASSRSYDREYILRVVESFFKENMELIK